MVGTVRVCVARQKKKEKKKNTYTYSTSTKKAHKQLYLKGCGARLQLFIKAAHSFFLAVKKQPTKCKKRGATVVAWGSIAVTTMVDRKILRAPRRAGRYLLPPTTSLRRQNSEAVGRRQAKPGTPHVPVQHVSYHMACIWYAPSRYATYRLYQALRSAFCCRV